MGVVSSRLLAIERLLNMDIGYSPYSIDGGYRFRGVKYRARKAFYKF